MPSFKTIRLLVLENNFYFFTMYGHGGHLGHATWTILYTFVLNSQGGSTNNLALIGQAVSEEMFENGERRQQRRRSMVTL